MEKTIYEGKSEKLEVRVIQFTGSEAILEIEKITQEFQETESIEMSVNEIDSLIQMLEKAKRAISWGYDARPH